MQPLQQPDGSAKDNAPAKRLAITEVTIRNQKYTAYIALDERREFLDFQLFAPGGSLLNQICIGRVERVLPNIQAVFVRIAPEMECFLPFARVRGAIFTKKVSQKKDICQGDELVVQVIKDAVKTKQPVVSAQLTLSGRYSVLTTEKKDLSVSKKLSASARSRGKKLLRELCPDHQAKGYGVVLRTNSSQADENDLREDILRLQEKYLCIREKSRYLAPFTLLYESTPEYIQRIQAIRDFSQKSRPDEAGRGGQEGCSYDAIYTDIPEIYEQIAASLPYLTERGLLHRYQDRLVSLSVLYNIKGSIGRLLEKQVWLPSGANIVIESTEAMTVIDVNTAKNLKNAKSGKEATILKVNKEAAAEIARQLRLRNISGIIVIDFINMKAAGSDHELIRYLQAQLEKDVVPCQFVDITKLGLVELTRKKVHRSLAEMLNS